MGVSQRRILATGTFDRDTHPRVRVLLDGLRRAGWDVEEIVQPLGLSTADRVEILQRPVLLPRLVRSVAAAWWRLVPRLARRRRRGPRPDAVLVGYLGHFDAPLVRRCTRPVPLVLDFLVSGAATSVDRGETGWLKQRVLRVVDAVALAAADVVLVDTPEHAQTLPARHRPRAVVVPVGADDRWFAASGTTPARTVDPDRPTAPRGAPVADGEPATDGAPVADVEPDRLRVVFFGLFTPLQGAPVIAAALRELDGLVEATVIGSGQDSPVVDPLLAGVPHVTRHPWVPAEELPGLVARHDVCLGIFGTGDKARRVVPNKVYQGAAAGCVIVTSDTAPQRRVLGDDAVLVPAGDATALAAALRALAQDRVLLAALAQRSRHRAREEFSPVAVTRPLVELLGATPARAGRR